jgi:large subunit ribosomal protein L15
MQLHNLKPAVGSNKGSKRIARGQGSGKGGTSTRGHKGNQSRAGYKEKRKHEGGQTAIQMRLPKRGFHNSHRRYSSYGADTFTPFNLYLLQYYAVDKLGTDVLDADTFYQNGLISKTEMYKVLADGELTMPLFVSAHRFSATAKAAIEAAGGQAFYIFKLSQLQGLVHKYNLKYVSPATIAKYFKHVPENAAIHVIADGDVSLKFELQVHKIDALAKAQVEAVGGTVIILS